MNWKPLPVKSFLRKRGTSFSGWAALGSYTTHYEESDFIFNLGGHDPGTAEKNKNGVEVKSPQQGRYYYQNNLSLQVYSSFANHRFILSGWLFFDIIALILLLCVHLSFS